MAQKLPSKFLIFCLEAEIFKSSKLYFYVFNTSHNFKAREKFVEKHFLFKYLAKNVVL